MKRSPSALTAEMLQKDGWLVWTVERWIPGARIRVDLFGFLDQIAIRDGEVIGLQPTSWTNVPARVKKIADAEHVGEVRKLGWTLWVIGWKWDAKAREWKHRIVDVS
ncbi:hypothetical protein [Burkholderia latens]|uniref:hypothetical protein n=1 Tax=Burkholderia latens TaxID=488446 RepID=UPI001AEA0561|nr:hypothetical protein [Burkholderia latens]QTO46353.1 hypothetical protein J8I85_18075 [Burkholderia latens]